MISSKVTKRPCFDRFQARQSVQVGESCSAPMTATAQAAGAHGYLTKGTSPVRMIDLLIDLCTAERESPPGDDGTTFVVLKLPD